MNQKPVSHEDWVGLRKNSLSGLFGWHLCVTRQKTTHCEDGNIIVEESGNNIHIYEVEHGRITHEAFEYPLKDAISHLERFYNFNSIHLVGFSEEDYQTIRSMIEQGNLKDADKILD